MAACVKVGKKCLTFCRFTAKRRGFLVQASQYANVPLEDKVKQNEEEERLPQVGMSTDGRTLICWHPEPEHPYEHTLSMTCWHPEPEHPYEYTLPMNYDNIEAKEGNIPIQKQLLRKHETRHRKDGPTINELTRITYTTKHQWFPNKQKKYRSTHVKKEREGL